MNDTTPTAATSGTPPRLIPVAEWAKHHPWPKTRALRHLIAKSATNGLDRAVRRVGRRVLVDEAAFYRWVEEQNR